MERHINFSDVEAVVKKIYEKYKDFEVEGAVDSRLQGVDPSKIRYCGQADRRTRYKSR